MRTAFFTSALALLLPFLSGDIASAQVQSMRLLTSEIGWAADPQRLFWTTSRGREWKDITPKKPVANEEIASVFFLDTSTGWVLLSRYAESGSRFDFASTTDAGQSWSISRLNVPDPDPARGLSSQAWVDFVDHLHGWIMVRVTGNTAVSGGVLLRTEDGGQTWKSPRSGPPLAGSMRFITPEEGWLAGGADYELYVTRDGAESWREVSLPVPPDVRIAAQAAVGYDLPALEDSKHGYLQVFYEDGSNAVSVLFATGDGGQTWKFERILPRVIEAASIVVNSTWMAASSRGGHTLTLTRVQLGGAAAEATIVHADVSKFQGLRGVGGEEISFADAMHGWILPGELLSTANGGVTWDDVTPPQLKQPQPPAPPVFVKVPKAALSRQPFPAHATAPHYPSTFPPDLSIHLAFDSTNVLCTSSCTQAQSIAYMQTWWDSSPYFDTGLYLPGSPNRHIDPNLNANNAATWVAAIQTQGWGLIPIWFGLQAPCACLTGTYPNCTTKYSSYISSNTTTANTQGQFLDKSGTFSNVNDPLATNGSVAYDINNQAEIVGAYGSDTLHGYLKKGTSTPSPLIIRELLRLPRLASTMMVRWPRVDLHGSDWHQRCRSGGGLLRRFEQECPWLPVERRERRDRRPS